MPGNSTYQPNVPGYMPIFGRQLEGDIQQVHIALTDAVDRLCRPNLSYATLVQMGARLVASSGLIQANYPDGPMGRIELLPTTAAWEGYSHAPDPELDGQPVGAEYAHHYNERQDIHTVLLRLSLGRKAAMRSMGEQWDLQDTFGIPHKGHKPWTDFNNRTAAAEVISVRGAEHVDRIAGIVSDANDQLAAMPLPRLGELRPLAVFVRHMSGARSHNYRRGGSSAQGYHGRRRTERTGTARR